MGVARPTHSATSVGAATTNTVRVFRHDQTVVFVVAVLAALDSHYGLVPVYGGAMYLSAAPVR